MRNPFCVGTVCHVVQAKPEPNFYLYENPSEFVFYLIGKLIFLTVFKVIFQKTLINI